MSQSGIIISNLALEGRLKEEENFVIKKNIIFAFPLFSTWDTCMMQSAYTHTVGGDNNHYFVLKISNIKSMKYM